MLQLIPEPLHQASHHEQPAMALPADGFGIPDDGIHTLFLCIIDEPACIDDHNVGRIG